MLCPICKTALVISERQGIEIDYCPQCRGVWLDRSELDRIIERSAASFSAPKQESYEQRREHPDQRQHSDDRKYADERKYYDHGKHYRKKSLLSELFDF